LGALASFDAVTERVHYIVARSRHGWSVNVDADRLSEHRKVEDARRHAAMLTDKAQAAGDEASFVDLSDDPGADDPA
jgi:hypothetical protein